MTQNPPLQGHLEDEFAGLLRPVDLSPPDLPDCLGLDLVGLGGFWSRTHWERELAEPDRPGVGFRLGDQLVAMACGWLVLDELQITLLVVAPDRRRLGLGHRILTTLLERSRAAGARSAVLEVAAGNGAAADLYRACGFETRGIRRGYYRDGEDALIQWKNLASGEG